MCCDRGFRRRQRQECNLHARVETHGANSPNFRKCQKNPAEAHDKSHGRVTKPKIPKSTWVDFVSAIDSRSLGCRR